MKLKLVVLVVLVAIGVGALAVTFGGLGANAAAGTEYLTAAATVGDVTDDVAATGTLAAAESYGLIFGADPVPRWGRRFRPDGRGFVAGDRGDRNGRRHRRGGRHARDG